jgi:UDP-3-O-[3-hydroxymyristoyl] N-acetylglucosamine deacetylase
MGLIRGGSLENAIVLTNDGVMNGPLRYSDEFGRHKALDLIGDLALAGLPLLARVEAHKAGHSLHTALVSKLLADPSSWTIATDSGEVAGMNGEFADDHHEHAHAGFDGDLPGEAHPPAPAAD